MKIQIKFRLWDNGLARAAYTMDDYDSDEPLMSMKTDQFKEKIKRFYDELGEVEKSSWFSSLINCFPSYELRSEDKRVDLLDGDCLLDYDRSVYCDVNVLTAVAVWRFSQMPWELCEPVLDHLYNLEQNGEYSQLVYLSDAISTLFALKDSRRSIRTRYDLMTLIDTKYDFFDYLEEHPLVSLNGALSERLDYLRKAVAIETRRDTEIRKYPIVGNDFFDLLFQRIYDGDSKLISAAKTYVSEEIMRLVSSHSIVDKISPDNMRNFWATVMYQIYDRNVMAQYYESIESDDALGSEV